MDTSTGHMHTWIPNAHIQLKPQYYGKATWGTGGGGIGGNGGFFGILTGGGGGSSMGESV